MILSHQNTLLRDWTCRKMHCVVASENYRQLDIENNSSIIRSNRDEISVCCLAHGQ
jgi:hypothetical protein